MYIARGRESSGNRDAESMRTQRKRAPKPRWWRVRAARIGGSAQWRGGLRGGGGRREGSLHGGCSCSHQVGMRTRECAPTVIADIAVKLPAWALAERMRA